MEGTEPSGSSDPTEPSAFQGETNAKDPSEPNFSLSTEERGRMMKSIQEIFELDEGPSGGDEPMDDDGVPIGDPVDQETRTERLKGCLEPLWQLWWSGSEDIDIIAEKLADGSRDPRWRTPLGQSGVLNFFLEIFSTHILRHALKIHVLRLFGNACADRDENRARVVESNSMPSIIAQLNGSALLPFAIPVLYNICVDYEPAQKQASDCYLSKELIELASSSRLADSRDFLGYVCKILDLLITQTDEPDHALDVTPVVLIKLATIRENPTDLEDYLALVNTAIAYLQHEKFQKAIISHGGLDSSLAVIVDSYTRFDSNVLIGQSSPDEEEAKLLSQLQTKFNQTLSDVSALPEFKAACPAVSPFTSSLRRWLSSQQLQLQVCACIMLGNLARSDEACEEFVHTCHVHKPLVTVLTNANDSQLLHAALGFLKNLALPAKNKAAIGETGIFEILPRLWNLDTLQPIQLSSISLARQLLNGCWDNVRKIHQRLSSDQDSPANMRTNLSILIALFERTDVEPIKMEIARLITAVCRAFNTYKGRTLEQLAEIQKKFFAMHPDVGRPLGFMVSQTKWPIVRSEGWFVFALMARYSEGAQCISDLMQDVTVFQPLVETVTGKSITDFRPSSTTTSPASNAASPPSFDVDTLDTPQLNLEAHSPGSSSTPNPQAVEMARIDRENALVLVSELLKNRGDQMAVMRRALLEDLLKGGTELMVSYRESKFGGVLVPGEKRATAGLNLQEAAAQSISEF